MYSNRKLFKHSSNVKKKAKYRNLILDYFISFAVETMWPWFEADKMSFIASHLYFVFVDKSIRVFLDLEQRVSIAIQNGKAAFVLGTVRSSKIEEIFYL